MSWRMVFRPEVETDMIEAAAWYEDRRTGLGLRFVEEVIQTWNAISENPMLNSRKHRTKNLRWRHPESFPYRIVYEVNEERREVLVIAVLHAARHERHWQKRVQD